MYDLTIKSDTTEEDYKAHDFFMNLRLLINILEFDKIYPEAKILLDNKKRGI